ncbi:MAG: TRAP transporter small permease subunit [Burkholderiales bacterium]
MRGFELDCHAIIRSIDRFTDTTGKLVSAAILFMLVAINYECIARYLIGTSTSWVAETSVMANGAAFMLGCGYALLRRAHVRTDLFWDRYSGRTKGAIDLVSYILLFFPVMLAILSIGVDDTWRSYQLREASALTPWRPIMWPLRAALPLAALLLIVQGVSETLKSWHAVRTGQEYQPRERADL